MRIKQGDTVKVLSGVSRGKTGKVLRVDKSLYRVTVEGLNIKKKHTRPRKQGQKGQVVEFPAPINMSNVVLVCPKCGKTTRVSIHISENEKKRRKCKKCNEIID